MTIKWGWDDGYVNNRPARTLEVPDEDLEGLSEREQDDLIDEYVQDEFQNRVSFWWRREK